MAAPKPPTQNELALADAQHLMQLWLKTKVFLTKATTEDPITREEEQAFLESKSELSKYLRTLTSKLPEGISFGPEKMQELLRQSISIGHLRGLPRPDKQALVSQWHNVFVYLSSVTGAIQFLVEGYIPPQRSKSKGGSNLSDLKKAAGKEQKAKSMFASPKLYVVLVLIGAAVYILMKRLQ
jgi:hypothetical protein